MKRRTTHAFRPPRPLRALPAAAVVRALVMVIVLAALPRSAAATELLHPQDGPHADIRISVVDDAVRFDITMNLAFADSIAPTARELLDALPEVEAPMVEEALSAYFKEQNEVTIDGVVVVPRLDSFSVLRPDDSLLPLFPRSGRRGLLRVGFDLWYPIKSPPKQIGIVWATFPPDIVTLGDEPGEAPPLMIQAQLQAEGRLEIVSLTEDEPEYIWHATGETIEDRFQVVPAARARPEPRTVPGLSIGFLILAGMTLISCALPSARRKALVAIAILFMGGAFVFRAALPIEINNGHTSAAALPSEREALDIFAPLHANIYRAFDYTAESDVYDALSRSVDGRLLDRLYGEIYRSLIVYEEGGAVSRVKSVTPLHSDVLSVGFRAPEEGGAARPGFEIRSRWQVEGQVYHWGHSHIRINEYEADYTVLSTDEGWRIATSQVLEQFRIDTEAEGEEHFADPLPGLEL